MAPAPAPSGALPTPQVNGLPVPTFYPDGGQVGPETKLYLTLRENRGFRILYTLDYGRPQPGGEAGVSTTHEYTKPVHMRTLGGGESLIRAVCIGEDGTLGGEVARAFHVTHDYDDGGLSDDGAVLQQQQHPARSGWTTAPSTAEEAAALYERRSVSPASTPPPSYLPQQRRSGEGGMPPSPTPSNHSSQGGSKVKSLAYPPREASLDRAPECGAGNPAASINVGRSPSASPGSDVRSISARLSGRYSAQPTPEQSPDRSARCRSSSGPTQQQQQQLHSNAVTDLAGLVVPPPAWLTAKASAAGLPPSPQHQAPHPHTSPEYLDGELLVGKTSSGGSVVRSSTPPVEPAGSGGFAKRPPSEYRQPPAHGEPAPSGGVEVTSLDYLTHMVHSMDAQASVSSNLTVAAVASASSGGGGGVTNSSQRSGTVTSIDEVAVGSAASGGGGGGGGERKPVFAKSADAILSGSDEAGGVDAMGEALHVCDRCGRSWMLKDRMLKHKEFCSGPSRPSKSRSPSRKVTWGGGGGGSSSSFGGRDRRSSTGEVGGGRKGRSGSFSDCNSGLNGNESFYSRSSVGSNSCYSAATYSHTNRTEAQPPAAAQPRRSVGAHNSGATAGSNINNPSSNSLAGSNINTSFGSSQSRTSTSADTGPAPSQPLRPDQAKHKFSSPPASTHSSVAPSRLSTAYTAGGASREGGYGGYRKPNIKSPSRQPLAVPKGLHNCPHCSRAMKEAALDSHIKRCTEEPANKKRLEVEGENRRRMRESKQNGGSANAAQDGGAVGSAAHYPSVVGAGRFSASPADRRFGASKSLTPVLKPTSPPMAAHEMFGRTATLITHTHSPGAPANYRATAAAQQRDSASETASIASSQRPIKPSPLLQDRRNAWKRARAQSGMSASR